MSIAIMLPPKAAPVWEEEFRSQAPEVLIETWPNIASPENVELVVSWLHPHQQLQRFPNLRVVASAGAGVDHILHDPSLNPSLQVTRIVDPTMAEAMAEYVLCAVLMFRLHLPQYLQQQRQSQWKREMELRPVRIGILGLGEYGTVTAKRLAAQGYVVSGWSNSPKQVPGVSSFAGPDELPAFLQSNNVFVCLLPLTPKTENILCSATFLQMPKSSFLINVARGEHLVEDDLLESLTTGQLIAAQLDVQRQEPLPVQHKFWNHPQILLTPHSAASGNLSFSVAQILQNYQRLLHETNLLHVVDRERGY